VISAALANLMTSTQLVVPRSDMLNIRLVKGVDLTDDLAIQWEKLRAENPRLYSPFYSFDFTRVVARVRDDVEVAVISDEDAVVGFFPFHRIKSSHAIPVGGKMNDAHGPISSAATTINMQLLLRKCGLQSWDFHALFWPVDELENCSFTKIKSYMACLDNCPEGYRKNLESRNYTIEAHRRKSRKFAKKFPNARLEFHSTNVEYLEKLIQLKSEQYQRTHIFDIFSVPWTTNLVREFMGYTGHALSGCLSVLFADEQNVVAMHFGIREGDLLHYWFPVYSPEFSQYSPGTELFLQIVDAAPSNGIQRIDMGYGEQLYKEKLVNRIDEALVGTIATNDFVWGTRRCQYLVRERMKSVILKETIKRGIRFIWPSFGKGQFR
jgi:CelD/BcsL family acetyltransferase involved in cellulose biosynthesis